MVELSEIKERLKAPKKGAKISKAVSHERRVRFHSETSLSQADSGISATIFLDWVKSLIPLDKYQIFLSLFSYPVKTTELTDQIYQALEKVFDGTDPVHHYDFVSNEILDDWNEYRKEILNDPLVWREKGFKEMQSGINSIVIVDLPQIQTSPRPQPYFYFLEIQDVIDFEEDDENGFEWVMFKQDDGNVAFFDVDRYMVFSTKDDKYQEITEILVDTPHDLGFCPAQWFWTDTAMRKDPVIKKSPISNQLGDLDWLLFFSISKKHLDLYAPYPIYSGFIQDCDYGSDELGQYCNDGFLVDGSDNYIISSRSGALMPCPVCSKKRLAGVGSFIEIPPPGPENDKADLRNPVQITTIDRTSLDYNVEEVARLKQEIYRGVTGYGGESPNDQAINEKQVIAAFESRTSVLKNLKKNFEKIHTWTNKVICKLRYGSLFLDGFVNYGNTFYLYTPEEALQMYLDANEDSSTPAILDLLQDNFYKTKFKNNPNQLARWEVIKNLDPFRHLGRDEVKKMYEDGEITYFEYLLKVNFSSLIMRFERENTSLVEFGSEVDFSVKINRILEALMTYIIPPGQEEIEGATIKEILEAYGIGVRSGAITAQEEDEVFFRSKIGVPGMGTEALTAWSEEGVRRPVTLTTQTETQQNIENSNQ